MCFRSPFSVYKCGKCPECLQDKRREWSIRLQLHKMYSGQKPYIAHLTYNNEHLPHTDSGVPTLSKRDVQLFIKRLRYYVKDKISYYLCGEYGPNTSRPHYHCIIFGIDEEKTQDEVNKILQSAWSLGYVRRRSQWVQSYAQLHYVTKYVINFYDKYKDDRLPPFRLSSNKFGYEYIKIAKEKNLYPKDIQDKFVCTYKKSSVRNSRSSSGWSEVDVPLDWLDQEPIVGYNEYTHKFEINPILINFPDKISLYEVISGHPKKYDYPLPRYFSEKLYSKSFRSALAIKKEAENVNRSIDYNDSYSDYDSTSDVPMWLQLKRYRWERKKKNYKDKVFRDLLTNKIID